MTDRNNTSQSSQFNLLHIYAFGDKLKWYEARVNIVKGGRLNNMDNGQLSFASVTQCQFLILKRFMNNRKRTTKMVLMRIILTILLLLMYPFSKNIFFPIYSRMHTYTSCGGTTITLYIRDSYFSRLRGLNGSALIVSNNNRWSRPLPTHWQFSGENGLDGNACGYLVYHYNEHFVIASQIEEVNLCCARYYGILVWKWTHLVKCS